MSRKIVQILLEKLEQETRRSAFLNCLQGFSSGTRFDVTRLNQLDPFTARDVMRELFHAENGEVEVKLTDEQPWQPPPNSKIAKPSVNSLKDTTPPWEARLGLISLYSK